MIVLRLPICFYTVTGPQTVGLRRQLNRGPIDTIPELTGLSVHYPGHTGVYIGNGYVVEARGTFYGIVKTELKARPWRHWAKLTGHCL